MSLPFTSVVSYHTNEYGCGVAKFSGQLAQRLGVPLVRLAQPDDWGAFPLLSLKWAELDPHYHIFTRHYCHPVEGTVSAETWRTCRARPYGVFWHDGGDPVVTRHAAIVYYGDPALGTPGLFCPSLLAPVSPPPVRFFSFGMAHKFQAEPYRQIRTVLEAAGVRYHVRVSVGLHEGTDLGVALRQFDPVIEILGPEQVTLLGILSDDAVSRELQAADAVLVFFESGARLNNTTIHAALEARRMVITNHDAATPPFLRAATRDILTMRQWEADYPYSWATLLARMEDLCGDYKSAPASSVPMSPVSSLPKLAGTTAAV